jgi:hypothetical protein
MGKGDWIAGSIQHPGAFKKKSKAAGMGTEAFAEKVAAPNSKASATTKRQANLAKTLASFNKR